jgi:hypothetical protein
MDGWGSNVGWWLEEALVGGMYESLESDANLQPRRSHPSVSCQLVSRAGSNSADCHAGEIRSFGV